MPMFCLAMGVRGRIRRVLPPSRRSLVAAACGIALLAGSVCVTSGGAGAASSNATVSVTVASATSLDASACATGTASITDFGAVLPGTSNVTASDCSLTWGSSNDTAMLRTYQQDCFGSALWRVNQGRR